MVLLSSQDARKRLWRLAPRGVAWGWRRTMFVSAFLIALTALMLPAPAPARGVVAVSTVEDLYAAVNNPANEGAVIDVAPGTYVLTPTDLSGNPRPNLGSLVLPSGAVLRGHNEYVDFDGDGIWDPRDPGQPEVYADPVTETILDASNLAGLTGQMNVISLGLNNQVDRLTVRNNLKAGALIGVTIKPSTGGLQGVVSNCIAQGGQRGIRATHDGGAFSRLTSRAVFEGNISRHNSRGVGFGIQIQNASVTNATWQVSVRNNRSYGNKNFGLFVVAVSSNNAQESVISMNNVYEQNSAGVVLHAGRDAASQGGFLEGSNGNQLRLVSVGDAIWNNNANLSPVPRGGVDARAGFRTSASASTSSDNSLRLQLIGTRFVQGSGHENRAGTSRRDLTLYGAFGMGGAFPGSGNVAELLIRNSISDGAPRAFLVIDSDPPAPNEAKIIGSDQAIESANTGIVLDPLEDDTPP